MRRLASALVVLVGLAAGCRTPLGPVQPLPPGDARPSALVADLARQARTRHSLRALAHLSLDGPAGSGRAKQVLVLERPARLRVETLGFLDQTVAVLVTDGERYRLFRTQERTLEEGRVHPALLYEVAGVALTAAEAVEVLLGVPAPPLDLLPAGGALLPDGGLRIDLAGARGALQRRLEFDDQQRLRRVEVRDAGRVLWEARFDEYRPVGAASFAHRVELRFPPTDTRARVSFRHVELNPELPPEVFVLRLPADVARGGPG